MLCLFLVRFSIAFIFNITTSILVNIRGETHAERSTIRGAQSNISLIISAGPHLLINSMSVAVRVLRYYSVASRSRSMAYHTSL